MTDSRRVQLVPSRLLPSAQPSASTSRRAIQIGHRGLRTVPTAVTLGALGVVYGDIGTSPLYALKEAVKAANAGAAPTPESVAQRHGTGFIGGIFGPIMLVWFVVIGALGLRGIVMVPVILAAFNPFHAIALLTHGPPTVSFAVPGATFLAVAKAAGSPCCSPARSPS